jgi:hypothetical protein
MQEKTNNNKKGSTGKMKLLFNNWLNKIDEHFEKEFWIDQTNL